MIRVGLFGAGNIGLRRASILENFRYLERFPKNEISWVYDPYKNEFNDPKRIKQADCIFICTPDFVHEENIDQIIKDNLTRYVYIEKPISEDYVSTVRIIKKLRDNNISFRISKNQLYVPYLKESIDRIRIFGRWEINDNGNRAHSNPIEVNMKINNSGGEWVEGWRTKRRTRGVFLDLGIYLLMACDIIFKGEVPLSVTAIGKTMKWNIPCEDYALVQLDYGKSIATLSCSWNDSGNFKEINALWNDKAYVNGKSGFNGSQYCESNLVDDINPESSKSLLDSELDTDPNGSHVQDMVSFINQVSRNEEGDDGDLVSRTMYLMDRVYHSMKLRTPVHCGGIRR